MCRPALRSAVSPLLASLVIAVLASMAPHTPASAQNRAPPSEALGGSESIMKIENAALLPISRRITLGLHKAMIVELPVDVQDVIVSHPETIDATILTARRVVLIAKAAGEANAFFLGRDGRKLVVLDFAVKRDLGDLAAMMKRLLPGSKIGLSMSGEGLVLSGRVVNPGDASRAEDMAKQYVKNGTVVNLISVAEKEQVALKVTISEMQRDAVKRLGVNLPGAVGKAGAFTFTKVIENNFPVSALVAAGSSFAGITNPPNIGAGSALQGTASWNGNTAVAIIEALERVGLAKTLAEPTLTAVSGETAKFLAGGEFAIPVSSRDNTVTVEWKQFGVSVSFTPYVLSEGRINLKVAAEVSELTAQGAVTIGTINIPGLQVRRAETSVEMASGAALAIAGLLSDQTRQNIDGIPELRNLPILGALFRSKDYRNSATELVILVTPYVVRPTDPGKLSRADEGFAPASDLKGAFRGHLHRVYKHSGPLVAGAKDDYGFIVEYPEHGVPK
jgi:pilus assembly protein CpaC